MKKRCIISICSIIFFIMILLGYLYFCIIVPSPFLLKILLCALCVALFYVCILALKENVKIIKEEKKL
ncbi:MAG TPA: hypothetical protein IAB62_11250 [Candidatus Coprocola pullicola]|nr:hypothetical protein [Candidatus Coprocola pullicola]